MRVLAVALACTSVSALRLPPVTPALERGGLDRRSASSLLGLGCLAPVIQWPEPAMAAQDQLRYFPGSQSSMAVDKAVGKTLAGRGYTKDNCLFGMSVCSDEVNFADKELIQLMKQRWGESFSLGGLAGVPFAGKAGLSAYAHHVPDSGRLLVVFAPHVGIDVAGSVGALERQGMSKPSGACGAALGAYKTLKAPGAGEPAAPGVDYDDWQFEYIKYKLAPNLVEIDQSADKISYVTYQMYQVVRDAMLAEIKACPALWDDCTELAVLGGVQINRFNQAVKKRDNLEALLKTQLNSDSDFYDAKKLLDSIDIEGGDAFQPLMFQATNKAGDTVDLFSQTFGDKPNLVNVLGSKSAHDQIMKGSV